MSLGTISLRNNMSCSSDHSMVLKNTKAGFNNIKFSSLLSLKVEQFKINNQKYFRLSKYFKMATTIQQTSSVHAEAQVVAHYVN